VELLVSYQQMSAEGDDNTRDDMNVSSQVGRCKWSWRLVYTRHAILNSTRLWTGSQC